MLYLVTLCRCTGQFSSWALRLITAPSVKIVSEFYRRLYDIALCCTGAVYIFETVDFITWSEQLKVLPSDTSFNDQFGSSLALLKDTFVAGAGMDGEFEGAPEVLFVNCLLSR